MNDNFGIFGTSHRAGCSDDSSMGNFSSWGDWNDDELRPPLGSDIPRRHCRLWMPSRFATTFHACGVRLE